MTKRIQLDRYICTKTFLVDDPKEEIITGIFRQAISHQLTNKVIRCNQSIVVRDTKEVIEANLGNTYTTIQIKIPNENPQKTIMTAHYLTKIREVIAKNFSPYTLIPKGRRGILPGGKIESIEFEPVHVSLIVVHQPIVTIRDVQKDKTQKSRYKKVTLLSIHLQWEYTPISTEIEEK